MRIEDEGPQSVRASARASNDLGLISEEYDTVTKRLIGNFPKAFTHLALIQSVSILGSQAVAGEMPSPGGEDVVPV